MLKKEENEKKNKCGLYKYKAMHDLKIIVVDLDQKLADKNNN